jgi:hypothetical protein
MLMDVWMPGWRITQAPSAGLEYYSKIAGGMGGGKRGEERRGKGGETKGDCRRRGRKHKRTEIVGGEEENTREQR